AQDAGMSRYPQKFIDDWPSGAERRRGHAQTIDPSETLCVERRRLVDSVNQDIGVDQNHRYSEKSSRTLYKASRSEMSTKSSPPSKVGSGRSFAMRGSGWRYS